VCRKQLTKFQAKTFVEAIDNEYRVHWIVDNLPSSTVYHIREGQQIDIYTILRLCI